MDGLTVGRMVHFILSKADAEQVNRRRTDSGSVYQRLENGTWPRGAQAHIGNDAHEGDHYPAVIVQVWSQETGNSNLKVLLDGNDDFWATSISYDEVGPDAPGSTHTWHWIEKA